MIGWFLFLALFLAWDLLSLQETLQLVLQLGHALFMTLFESLVESEELRSISVFVFMIKKMGILIGKFLKGILKSLPHLL